MDDIINPKNKELISYIFFSNIFVINNTDSINPLAHPIPIFDRNLKAFILLFYFLILGCLMHLQSIIKTYINAIVPPDTPGTLSAKAIQNPLIKFNIYINDSFKVYQIIF